MFWMRRLLVCLNLINPKFKYGLGVGCSVIIGTMIEGENLKTTNYKSKD